LLSTLSIKKQVINALEDIKAFDIVELNVKNLLRLVIL